MSRATLTIPLSQAYAAHGKSFSAVTLREPTLDDLLDLGEPFEGQQSASGNVVVFENRQSVGEYVRRCISEPSLDVVLGAALSFRDARALREGVLSFFRRGEAPAEASPEASADGPTT